MFFGKLVFSHGYFESQESTLMIFCVFSVQRKIITIFLHIFALNCSLYENYCGFCVSNISFLNKGNTRKGCYSIAKLRYKWKTGTTPLFSPLTAKHVTHNTILYCVGTILLIGFNIYYLNLTVFLYSTFWNCM